MSQTIEIYGTDEGRVSWDNSLGAVPQQGDIIRLSGEEWEVTHRIFEPSNDELIIYVNERNLL